MDTPYVFFISGELSATKNIFQGTQDIMSWKERSVYGAYYDLVGMNYDFLGAYFDLVWA